jgi:hypothetical protein
MQCDLKVFVVRSRNDVNTKGIIAYLDEPDGGVEDAG